MTHLEARRIVLKMLAASSRHGKMQRELSTQRAVCLLGECLGDPSQENITNAVITIANIALNVDSHRLVREDPRSPVMFFWAVGFPSRPPSLPPSSHFPFLSVLTFSFAPSFLPLTYHVLIFIFSSPSSFSPSFSSLSISILLPLSLHFPSLSILCSPRLLLLSLPPPHFPFYSVLTSSFSLSFLPSFLSPFFSFHPALLTSSFFPLPQLLEAKLPRRLRPLLTSGPRPRFHAARALVYVGELDLSHVSVFHTTGYETDSVLLTTDDSGHTYAR